MPIFDRAIASAPLRSLIGKLFTDGIAPNPSNNLQVTTGSGMTVTVQAGFAICGSCLKLEEVARTLAVQASDANYDRIDTVVLRLNTNDNARYCDLYVVQGIPSTTPVRPALTRTSTIWELGLADVFVAKNSGAISTARITDTRYDATRCGVISSISEFDTTTIYNQVQADLAEFKAEEQADFLAWYERMRNQLSEDAAGSLQQQIDAMKDSILDTMGEIEANTQDDQLAGALALKELSEDVTTRFKGVVAKTDIVDNLESTETEKPLSAKQGNKIARTLDVLQHGSPITSYNANDYTGTFAISVGDGSQWTNLPLKSHGMFIGRNATDYIEHQFITQSEKYYRVSYNLGATWGDWRTDGGLVWVELLAGNVSTSEKTYTITDMSKYKALYFAIPYLELVRGGIVVPYALFEKFGKVNNVFVLGGPTYEYLVKWVSNTEITVSTTFDSGVLPFVVYGF